MDSCPHQNLRFSGRGHAGGGQGRDSIGWKGKKRVQGPASWEQTPKGTATGKTGEQSFSDRRFLLDSQTRAEVVLEKKSLRLSITEGGAPIRSADQRSGERELWQGGEEAGPSVSRGK